VSSGAKEEYAVPNPLNAPVMCFSWYKSANKCYSVTGQERKKWPLQTERHDYLFDIFKLFLPQLKMINSLIWVIFGAPFQGTPSEFRYQLLFVLWYSKHPTRCSRRKEYIHNITYLQELELYCLNFLSYKCWDGYLTVA
jgi:hypothetical protein